MSKRKILALALTVAMIAILAVGGSLAYFTAEDSATNVMTLGGVSIEQNETLKDMKTPFTDNIALLPATNTTVTPFVENGFFNEKVGNVVDKVVTVTNTATANSINKDAYVRTILAFETKTEYKEGTDTVLRNGQKVFNDSIGILCSKGMTYTDNMIVTVDGVEYYIVYKVYPEKLAPGATTEPSLKQIFMSPEVDNDDVALFGDTYTVLALSQATQTAGFNSAEEALNTAFGEINATNVAAWLAEVKD